MFLFHDEKEEEIFTDRIGFFWFFFLITRVFLSCWHTKTVMGRTEKSDQQENIFTMGVVPFHNDNNKAKKASSWRRWQFSTKWASVPWKDSHKKEQVGILSVRVKGKVIGKDLSQFYNITNECHFLEGTGVHSSTEHSSNDSHLLPSAELLSSSQRWCWRQ